MKGTGMGVRTSNTLLYKLLVLFTKCKNQPLPQDVKMPIVHVQASHLIVYEKEYIEF